MKGVDFRMDAGPAQSDSPRLDTKSDVPEPKTVERAGAVEELEDILVYFQNPVIICDSTSRAAAESFLEEEFKDYPVIELEPEQVGSEKSMHDEVAELIDFCDQGQGAVYVDILVAVGGKLIHELTAQAAREDRIVYISIPTQQGYEEYISSEYPPHWTLADEDIIK